MTDPTPTPHSADPVVSFLHRTAAKAAGDCRFETAVEIRAWADAIAQRDVSPPAAADHAKGPSVDDVDELCQEFGFHLDSDDDYSLSILRDMITAAITRWPAPVAQFGDLPEPDPCLGEVVGYIMGGHEIDGKRIRLSIAVLEPCPVDEWRPIARKALRRLTAPPVAQPPAQPVNLAKLRDPDFSGGLTPSQHLDVVHGGADLTWQSIKTAPKDGTLVLTISESGYPEEVISDNYKLCNFSFLQYNRTIDTWVDRLGSSGYFPTHWQPLPGPPNTINQPS